MHYIFNYTLRTHIHWSGWSSLRYHIDVESTYTQCVARISNDLEILNLTLALRKNQDVIRNTLPSLAYITDDILLIWAYLGFIKYLFNIQLFPGINQKNYKGKLKYVMSTARGKNNTSVLYTTQYH